MTKRVYNLINGITIYRIVAAPVLFFLVFTKQIELFKWLLAVSFFTDLIDGVLARKFKVTSILGSRLDSIGDDLTVLAGLVGLFVFRMDFIRQELVIISILLSLFLIQNILAFIRYRKITSFHTYLAKTSAILQGVFLILVFLLPEPVCFLFYVASVTTAIELAEEIALVIMLPEWEANVKGLYWVWKRKKIPFRK